jgi:hypothetical protein
MINDDLPPAYRRQQRAKIFPLAIGLNSTTNCEDFSQNIGSDGAE